MKLRPLYFLVLEDDTTFIGGTDISETKWMQIPNNKKIKRVFYSISDTDNICLSGYDEYAHMVEVCNDLNGPNKGKVRPQFTYILGKKGQEVTCYRLDFNIPKNIDVKKLAIDCEWIKGINKNIWK